MLLEVMNRVVASDETETLWHVGQDLSRGHQIPTPPTSSDALKEEKRRGLPLSTWLTTRQQTQQQQPT
jgi:hypothetical protein